MAEGTSTIPYGDILAVTAFSILTIMIAYENGDRDIPKLARYLLLGVVSILFLFVLFMDLNIL